MSQDVPKCPKMSKNGSGAGNSISLSWTMSFSTDFHQFDIEFVKKKKERCRNAEPFTFPNSKKKLCSFIELTNHLKINYRSEEP